MTSREQDADMQETVYEEEEVLWAKVRGYPWWPAFVDKVHPSKTNHESQYTVFFFGDNTHSKLGSSKLRKFIENYTQCYQKAKSHRKLMQSIQKAEEKLKQNDQNVEIFQTLRSTAKQRPRLQSNHRQDSQHKESQHQQLAQKQFNEIEHAKNDISFQIVKTVEITTGRRGRRRKQIKETVIQQPENVKAQGERIIQSQEGCQIIKEHVQSVDFQDHSENLPRNKVELQNHQDGEALFNLKNLSNKDDQLQNRLQLLPNRVSRQRKPIKETIFHEDQHSTNKVESQKYKQPISEIKQEIQQQLQLESFLLNNQDSGQQIRPQITQKKSNAFARDMAPRKRGRPRKRQDLHSSVADRQVIQAQKNERHSKRKTIHKHWPSNRIVQYSFKPLSLQNRNIVDKIRPLLLHREQLANYIETIPITIDNVKQILDLDVSNILQEGPMSDQIIGQLQLFRAALLYKYFPEDFKNRKKYERIVKKRNRQQQRDQLENPIDENNDMQSEHEIIVDEKRKKTLAQLERILKKNQDEDTAKYQAIQIEQQLFKHDESIGDKYKQLSARLLKSMKERQYSSQLLDELWSSQ